MTDSLRGIKILIVDDEPDVLEVLSELLSQCIIDSADSYDTAKQLLAEKTYAAAILDIMGVNGYDLLELCRQKQIPAIMLTAHALSPGNLVASINKGAYAYIPKDDMINIDRHLAEVIASGGETASGSQHWFKKLAPVFDKKFGPDWKIRNKEFLKEFNLGHTINDL